MPGKQLVPYDPDRPHYQPRNPSLFARVNDGIESLVLDENRIELGGLGRALLKALGAAFIVTAGLLLIYNAQIGVITGRDWARHPDGPLAGVRDFLLWWLALTLRHWHWLGWLWLAFGGWPALKHGARIVPVLYRRRRERREAVEDAQRQRIRDYELKQQEIAMVEVRRRQAEAKTEADRLRAIHAYLHQREAERQEIERSINVEVARERLNGIADDEDPEAPYLRVRTSLLKVKLPAKWGLLHETRDSGVIRVLGDNLDWLPPLPPYPLGYHPALLEPKR